MIPSREDFYKSVVEIKENLLQNGLSKISADNLEKLFNYFEAEYPKIYTGDLPTLGTNERVKIDMNQEKSREKCISVLFSCVLETNSTSITFRRKKELEKTDSIGLFVEFVSPM